MDPEGAKLLETFPVRSRRLRPRPPAAAQLATLSDYEVPFHSAPPPCLRRTGGPSRRGGGCSPARLFG